MHIKNNKTEMLMTKNINFHLTEVPMREHFHLNKPNETNNRETEHWLFQKLHKWTTLEGKIR